MTVLLELAARRAAQPPPSLELVFTVAEETACGQALDVGGLRFAVRLRDRPRQPDRRGDAAPTYQRLVASSRGGGTPGPPDRAQREPPRRRSQDEPGRLDEETTANIGIIEGGSGHRRRTLPDRGRARSIDRARCRLDIDACSWAASEHGCDVDVQVASCSSGPRPPVDPAQLAMAALQLRAGGRRVTGGGSDANALIASGSTASCWRTGTAANHARGERSRCPPGPDAGDLRGDRRRGGEVVRTRC